MLGLVCLLLILLIMGLYSINQCSELGKRIQKISRDNDRVGSDIQKMKRAGASMTGSLLTLAVGDGSQSHTDFEKAAASFQEALKSEQDRDKLSTDEKALLRKLANSFKAYSDRASVFVQSAQEGNTTWRSDAATLGRETAGILDLLDQFNTAHEQSLSDGGKSSADDINRTIRLLLLFMALATIAFIFAYFGLSRGLLNPLKSLTSSIKQVGEGNLDQAVPVVSKDELGLLATSFNQMAAQLRVYQANTSVELVRLNETIRTTLASFPDPVFVLNATGAVEFRNPAADQLAMKLLFAGVTRLPAKVDEKVEEVRATGVDYLPTSFQEAVKFYIDGQDRYFLPRIVLLRSENGVAFGVAVILENVTRMLLLDDVKSNLIATVSHELKTPMTSVRMAIYLLFEKTLGPLNDKQTELIAAAREDADRLLKTLNDLLDLAKLEQGTTPLQMKPATPTELVEAAERANREVVSAAKINLKKEVLPDLPSVTIDPQRMAYVFSNFITNAVKFSPTGTTLLLKAEMGEMRDARKCVRFSVKDEGPGIDLAHQEHVFDRFYRVPGTNKSGAGLGLSIAKEIVVAHHGEIGVISHPGKGSEFFFVLPLSSDDF